MTFRLRHLRAATLTLQSSEVTRPFYIMHQLTYL